MDLASLQALERGVLSGLRGWAVGEEARYVGQMVGPGVVQVSVRGLLMVLGDDGRGRRRCDRLLLVFRRGNGRGDQPADDRVLG